MEQVIAIDVRRQMGGDAVDHGLHQGQVAEHVLFACPTWPGGDLAVGGG